MSDMVLISTLADGMLSAALLVLWLVQREERHALYWGLGQLSLGILTVIWYWQQQGVVAPWIPWSLRVSLSLGLLFYIQGTLYATGRWMSWRTVRWSFVALLAFFAIGAQLIPGTIQLVAVLMLASCLLWAGYQLARGPGTYRVVGAMLAIRGLLNLAFALQLHEPQTLSVLYGVAFAVKTASMLGLLYVVQHEARQRFPNAMRFLAEGIWVHDRQGRILFANPACASFFGYDSVACFENRRVQDFMPFITQEVMSRHYLRLSSQTEQFPLRFEHICRNRHGHTISFEALVSPYWQGGQLFFLSQLRNIEERKRQEQLLQLAANVDDVTELASRYALNEQLRTLLHHDAEPVACALIFMDLDHFKRINDSLGHMLGDQLLHAVAERLRQLVTPAICVARFGGDEFVVMLTDTSAERAREEGLMLAGQIHEAFRRPFSLGAMEVVVTISTGMAVYPTQAQDADMLLRYADSAMYAAKRAGRNQHCLFDASLARAVQDSLSIDMALRQALDSNEFSLVYQPIIDVWSGQWCKVEALVRWHSPSLGFVSPDRFIPVAEESGLIVPLGLWILREACRQLGVWQRGTDATLAQVRMSVNVAAWQLADGNFIRDVELALQDAGISASSLELELTERTLIEEDPVISTSLEALRQMGVKLALDDFGTGYSSLNYLSRFRLDTLKIDRSFIIELETNQRCRDLTRHIIGMGKTLGLVLVAEGVETQAQADLLSQFGCEQLQGYLFSRPLAAAELGRQLELSHG